MTVLPCAENGCDWCVTGNNNPTSRLSVDYSWGVRPWFPAWTNTKLHLLELNTKYGSGNYLFSYLVMNSSIGKIKNLQKRTDSAVSILIICLETVHDESSSVTGALDRWVAFQVLLINFLLIKHSQDFSVIAFYVPLTATATRLPFWSAVWLPVTADLTGSFWPCGCSPSFSLVSGCLLLAEWLWAPQKQPTPCQLAGTDAFDHMGMTQHLYTL